MIATRAMIEDFRKRVESRVEKTIKYYLYYIDTYRDVPISLSEPTEIDKGKPDGYGGFIFDIDDVIQKTEAARMRLINRGVEKLCRIEIDHQVNSLVTDELVKSSTVFFTNVDMMRDQIYIEATTRFKCFGRVPLCFEYVFDKPLTHAMMNYGGSYTNDLELNEYITIIKEQIRRNIKEKEMEEIKAMLMDSKTYTGNTYTCCTTSKTDTANNITCCTIGIDTGEYACLCDIGSIHPDPRRKIDLNNPVVKYPIKKIETYNDKVVKVTFDDGSFTKAVCSDNDKYDIDTGITICLIKKMLGDKGTQQYNDYIRYAHKVMERNERNKAKKKEEKAKIKADNKKREQRIATKKQKAKQEQIDIQKQAFVEAMKELKENDHEQTT